MTDIPELPEEQLARAIPARVRKRLIQGRFESGEDIAALRRFDGLTQTDFARAIEISIHTLRNREQGRRKPEGPAIALLKIAARQPRIIRENLRTEACAMNHRREHHAEPQSDRHFPEQRSAVVLTNRSMHRAARVVADAYAYSPRLRRSMLRSGSSGA